MKRRVGAVDNRKRDGRLELGRESEGRGDTRKKGPKRFTGAKASDRRRAVKAARDPRVARRGADHARLGAMRSWESALVLRVARRGAVERDFHFLFQ